MHLVSEEVYKLTAEELTTDKDKAETMPLFNTYHIIKQYFDITPNSSIDFVTKYFEMSYNLFSGYAQKAAYLFTIIDTIIGDLKSWKIYKTPVRISFSDRAKIILNDYPDFEKEISWLSDGEGGARHYRNKIAHGQPEKIENDIKGDFTRIQNIARHMIKKYILFYILTETNATLQEELKLAENKLLTEKFYLFIKNVKSENNYAVNLLSEINNRINCPLRTI